MQEADCDPYDAALLLADSGRERKTLLKLNGECEECRLDPVSLRPVEGSRGIDWMSMKAANDKLMDKLKLLEQRNSVLVEELRETRELKDKFQAIVDNARDSIFCKGEDRKYTYVNTAMCRLLDCSEVDLIGKAPEEIFDVNEAAIIREVDQRNLNGEVVSAVRNLTINKRVYVLHTVQSPLRDHDGNVVGITGVVRDITELKLAEEALRESEARFRQFFEHLTMGVAVYEAVDDGADFVFYDVNPAGQKLSKVSIDEIRGKRITQVFPSIEDLGLLTALRHTWRTGESFHVPLRQYKDNRIVQWVENRIFKLPSGKIVAAYDDRTELILLEEGMRQAQKMEAIGTLAGGIAHDFNNVLSVITGNISYALSVLDRSDALFDVMSDMLLGANQAQSLTQQLLTFAKGGQPIRQALDINELLQKSVKFVASGSKSKCVFKLAEDLRPAEVDSGQISQLISNIVINADQAMPNGGCILVKTENVEIGRRSAVPLSVGRYIRISIKDQGVGIDKDCLPKIFDPYFTTKSTGNGLGLATSYSIARRHDGHISVSSEPGKGTEFSIFLPASLASVIEAEKNAVVTHTGEGRILVMDDQPAISVAASRILQSMGYETISVADGAEAIRVYRESHKAGKPFDFVILDLTVPGGMGGAEALQELLRFDPKARAIVSSGYSNDPVMAKCRDYGFCGVLPKPFTSDSMSELLNRL